MPSDAAAATCTVELAGALVTRHLHIRGVVQGVGYRGSMVQAAQQRGVQGWVRNRRDGSVEALLQGDSAAVDAMIAWCRRGPPSAVVAEVKVTEATGDYPGFETLPTE